MKTVKFIKGLVIDEVALLEGEDLHQWQYPIQNMARISSDSALMTEEKIDFRVVPIHHLRDSKRQLDGSVKHSDTYIAYSDEVKDLLEMPFDVLQGCIDAERAHSGRIESQLYKAESENRGYDSRMREIDASSLWKRIKFVFTKKI